MKRLLLITILGIGLLSCTENQRARNFGGVMTIELPKGEKLVNVTWKADELWYLTEEMESNYISKTKTFKQKNPLGVNEGKVVFIEKK
jgi:hypothetical protein